MRRGVLVERIIAVNSNCYHGYSIEEALEGIRKAGFHYIELTATKGWTEHVFPNQSFEYLCKLRDEMKAMDIVPFSMSGHCNLMDKQRLADFILNIKLAAFFHCEYIVSSIGEAHLEDKTKSSNDILAQNIKSVIPYLEEYDMKLVLEAHGEHSTGTILKEIVTLINSDRVKINYDTANVIFYGDVNPSEDIDICIDDVDYMHLKDKAGDKKQWNFPALGKGYVDFETIFNKLNKANNNCPYSIEIEFTEAGPASLKEIDDAVMDSANYLKSLGFKL